MDFFLFKWFVSQFLAVTTANKIYLRENCKTSSAAIVTAYFSSERGEHIYLNIFLP